MEKERSLLIVFLRYPEVGRVKTRMAVGLGAEKACAIYGELVRRTLVAVAEASAVNRLQVWLYFDPPERGLELREWLDIHQLLNSFELISQPVGDLGSRLEYAFSQAFTAGFARVCVIGTDCPALTSAHLQAAFAALTHSEVVIGPATDGGYYLLGQRRFLPALFREIPWSSPHTFGATYRAAAEAGISIEIMPALDDIDTAEDWQRWISQPDAAPL